MLQVAKSLNVQVDMLSPSQEVQWQIPVWYHIGFKAKSQRRYGSKMYKCLDNKHGVETSGDAADIAARLTLLEHKPQWDCKCTACLTDWQQHKWLALLYLPVDYRIFNISCQWVGIIKMQIGLKFHYFYCLVSEINI
ncbi:hypothetical protein EDD85DRAFT_771338 [Armillaria nabsnona]|nr:hypothetical protein EDD85DRAFT_771338 [Armillaria nabsnona]